MPDLRFALGHTVMCNLGPSGWKLGRIIALHYHEPHWPAGQCAPYQVALEEDHALIYVPVDDARYCREPTAEDLRMALRMDALAALPEGMEAESAGAAELACGSEALRADVSAYRSGKCACCHSCPRSWTAVELYSEHYRCAARNGLKVTRRSVDLGTLRVGDVVAHRNEDLPSKDGFLQCPTLARLPPGLQFSDDGSLTGEVGFDPQRFLVEGDTYRVEFVAVSTADWHNAEVGLVRLETTFTIEGNTPPIGFDLEGFRAEQTQARAEASRMLEALIDTWESWERGALDHRGTCDRMGAILAELRELCEAHPRLDDGRWWAQLGGFHMNTHKLLENTLFECELYLGHALTFPSAEVRSRAELNLEGCYSKRLLEAARFQWVKGCEQMLRDEWEPAVETFRLAAAQKDGWGWAVNYGDIWMAEAAARLIRGAELEAAGDTEGSTWIAGAARAQEKAAVRIEEAGGWGGELSAGHPWASEIDDALAAYDGPNEQRSAEFRLRTHFWCAQVLGGVAPFPPKVRPRLAAATELRERLPGHNA